MTNLTLSAYRDTARVEVLCTCGRKLDAEARQTHETENVSTGIRIYVKPCEHCINEAVEEAISIALDID